MKISEIIDSEGFRIGRYWSCYCNNLIESYGGSDVSCDECGQLFNGYGQSLKPQSQWEEQDDY
jgi:hypothetical protein